MAADPDSCTSAGEPVDRAKSEPSEKWCSIFSIPVTQSIDEDAEIKDEDDDIKPEEYEVENNDEHEDSEHPVLQNKKRTRRGKKRKKLGSSERRWNKLENAQQWM